MRFLVIVQTIVIFICAGFISGTICLRQLSNAMPGQYGEAQFVLKKARKRLNASFLQVLMEKRRNGMKMLCAMPAGGNISAGPVRRRRGDISPGRECMDGEMKGDDPRLDKVYLDKRVARAHAAPACIDLQV